MASQTDDDIGNHSDDVIVNVSDSNGNSFKESKITPWEVEGEINYDKLIEKVQKLVGEIHPLLKLNYFFSHRDFDWILNKYERNENFYLYTGRGPSGMVHMGHLLPWLFTKYLQDKFNSKLLFQLTDDEKFLYNQDRTFQEIKSFTYENILDIIAIGFDAKRTKIIVDTKHIQYLYPLANEIAKRITFSTSRSVFGFTHSTNIGMIGFPPIQSAPCFLPSLIEGKPTPVLIPAAIDQDPDRMGYYKPAQIHSKFLPALDTSGKMSSSKPQNALFTTDDPETIDRKVSAAFTGGQPTVALQRQLGGNALECPVFWYLRYFFDSELQSEERLIKCEGGNLLCGECKSDLATESKSFMMKFKKRREKAKDIVQEFMYDGKPL
jgi:tryptophanyl-tRNA synthetase